MELWIRSQDRKSLIKSNGVGLTPSELSIYPIGLNGVLGTYETKERALEVLDEIQNILNPQLIIKDSGKIIGSFEDTIVREGATYELKELSTVVYQMPKK